MSCDMFKFACHACGTGHPYAWKFSSEGQWLNCRSFHFLLLKFFHGGVEISVNLISVGILFFIRTIARAACCSYSITGSLSAWSLNSFHGIRCEIGRVEFLLLNFADHCAHTGGNPCG